MKSLIINTLTFSSLLSLLSCGAPTGCLESKPIVETSGTFTVDAIEEVLSPNAKCQNGVFIKGTFKSDKNNISDSGRNLYFAGFTPSKEWANRKGITLGKVFKVKKVEGVACTPIENYIVDDLKDTDYCK